MTTREFFGVHVPELPPGLAERAFQYGGEARDEFARIVQISAIAYAGNWKDRRISRLDAFIEQIGNSAWGVLHRKIYQPDQTIYSAAMIGQAALCGYVRAVVLDRARMIYKANVARSSTIDPTSVEAHAADIQSELERDEWLRQRTARLTEAERWVIAAKRWGHDYSEMSEKVLVPVSTLRSRFARAIAKLAKE